MHGGGETARTPTTWPDGLALPFDHLASAASSSADGVLVHSGHQEMTFRDVLEQCKEIASWMRYAGVASADTVALDLPAARIAVVTDDAFPVDHLLERLTADFGSVRAVTFVVVPEIPRNPMGKAPRHGLSRHFGT